MGSFTYRLHHEPFRKPSKNEEEYFHRREFDERRKKARKMAEARAEEEKAELMDLHKNRCPRCGESLEQVEFREIRADQCPVCEGVWLDREVFSLLTHEKEQPIADIFRYLLLDQGLGDIHPEDERETRTD